MKLRLTITIGLIMLCSSSRAIDKYLDKNGTTVGFALSNTNTPHTTDPTAAEWNTDPTGGGGGTITTLSSNDVAVFMLSGTGYMVFNWVNFDTTWLGGITTGVERGNPNLGRMQKQGGGGMFLNCARNPVGDTTDLRNSFWWDMGTTNDFTKTGPTDLY